MSARQQTDLLERLFEPSSHSMTPDVANWLMGIRADDEMQTTFDELADRNTAGIITSAELDTYDEYLRVSRMVAVLQAKARKVLSRSNGH